MLNTILVVIVRNALLVLGLGAPRCPQYGHVGRIAAQDLLELRLRRKRRSLSRRELEIRLVPLCKRRPTTRASNREPASVGVDKYGTHKNNTCQQEPLESVECRCSKSLCLPSCRAGGAPANIKLGACHRRRTAHGPRSVGSANDRCCWSCYTAARCSRSSSISGAAGARPTSRVGPP